MPKLIVVDDEPDMAKLVQELANRLGYETYVADGGKGFMAIFPATQADVIVLDLVMPDIDGIELLKEIAATGSQAAIILMSGYEGRYLDMADRLAASYKLNILAVLAKPFQLSELRSLLQQALI